jgi:hypothetical protein
MEAGFIWLSIGINDQHTEMKCPISQKELNSMIAWVIISFLRRTPFNEANNIWVYTHIDTQSRVPTFFKMLRNFKLSYF